mmetsp:Transcript_30467/g.52843  ORF Transcript_30467/g.52843 Transcript_30467/m.52843 type:complete len:96 (-) Transcript_30467:543-830(-)
MSRRTEDTDPTCAVTQTSLFVECCYEKCNLTVKPGTYPDWAAEVVMDGNMATCLELADAIKEASIAKDNPQCQSRCSLGSRSRRAPTGNEARASQ